MNSQTKNRYYKLKHSFYLFLATLFWGTTFVAQSSAAKHIEPFTYNFCRFFIGALFLLPFAFISGRKEDHPVNWKNLISGGTLVGLCLFLAGGFQQTGIAYTSAGKSGFITALYIVLVPILGLLIFRKKCSITVIPALFLAVTGFYFLCIKKGSPVNRGDIITLGSSVLFAMHILTVDYFNPKTNGVQLSCVQFIVSGLLSLAAAFLFETPSLHEIQQSIFPILYAGIFSSGCGYTLQIIGQDGLNPAAASMIMSLESVVAAISGWIILGDNLSPRELFGCLLVFLGVILAQIPVKKVSGT